MTGPAVYLDANALIEAVEGSDPTILSVLAALRRRGRNIVTSELTLAEVMVKPLRDGESALCGIYERLVAPNGLVMSHVVDREILRKSAAIRAEAGGKLPDCIHSATAVLTNCDTIVSSDKRLPLSEGLRRLDTGRIDLLLAPDSP